MYCTIPLRRKHKLNEIFWIYRMNNCTVMGYLIKFCSFYGRLLWAAYILIIEFYYWNVVVIAFKAQIYLLIQTVLHAAIFSPPIAWFELNCTQFWLNRLIDRKCTKLLVTHWQTAIGSINTFLVKEWISVGIQSNFKSFQFERLKLNK